MKTRKTPLFHYALLQNSTFFIMHFLKKLNQTHPNPVSRSLFFLSFLLSLGTYGSRFTPNLTKRQRLLLRRQVHVHPIGWKPPLPRIGASLLPRGPDPYLQHCSQHVVRVNLAARFSVSLFFLFFFLCINSNFIWIHCIRDKNYYLCTV